ncbi:MAG: rRNA maturation RNase YbeY, partial [Alphaproteobacteria bacterium]
AAAALGAARPTGAGVVAVLLTDDATVTALNRRWRKIDRATNVLAFPAGAGPVPPDERTPLGDVALAYETVAAEALRQGKSIDAHLAHLVVHGVLHLVGYDHGDATAAGVMAALEVRVLGRLGYGDPYQPAGAT